MQRNVSYPHTSLQAVSSLNHFEARSLFLSLSHSFTYILTNFTSEVVEQCLPLTPENNPPNGHSVKRKITINK